jgi:phage baseplate assembly protein W
MANKRQGISVSLPLVLDNTDGPYKLNKNLGQVVRQNFKNLLLTSPGERIMIPTFGVGLKRMLFENFSSRTKERIVTAIQEQVDDFMPFVEIERILFSTNEDDKNIALNELRIRIQYGVSTINFSDTLEFTEEITI